MRLREIAHSRTGDKGDTSNISVIAFDPKDYPLLVERVTAERVAAHFAGDRDGSGHALRAAERRRAQFRDRGRARRRASRAR